jgi:cytidylate kinase
MYFVTVSEMIGTGGETIAREVASELQYGFYGEEEVSRAADKEGFLSDVQMLDEKGPGFLERLFSEKPKVYLDRLQSVIFEVAKKGNAVFFGRGSQLLLNSFDCALHVLVSGSTEKRIERVMREKKVDRAMAEKIVRRSDHDKRGFVRFAFEEDWLNPQLYDLILNTDVLSIGSSVKIIVDAAKSDEIKACGVDSVISLGKLSLHRKIEAAFLDGGISNPHLFLSVEDMDKVRIYGLVAASEEKEAIERIVRQIPGVKTVINDLSVMRGAMGGV